jgi:hypothetical protein
MEEITPKLKLRTPIMVGKGEEEEPKDNTNNDENKDEELVDVLQICRHKHFQE